MYSFLPEERVLAMLDKAGIAYNGFEKTRMNLEDAFIGLTGKY